MKNLTLDERVFIERMLSVFENIVEQDGRAKVSLSYSPAHGIVAKVFAPIALRNVRLGYYRTLVRLLNGLSSTLRALDVNDEKTITFEVQDGE